LPHEADAFDHCGELLRGDVAGRLRETAVRRDVDALRLDVLQYRPQSLGDQLRWLDPGILHVDQPGRQSHRRPDLARQFDLGHLAAGELERQLLHRRPGQVWEQRAITAMPDGAAAEVAEAHMQTKESPDTVDRVRDQIEELLRAVGPAGEARLV